MEQDRGDGRDRLNIVDDGGARVQAGNSRKWRLEAWLAAATLQGVKQRGLLTTDVSPGPGMHGDIQVEAAPEDVLAQVAGGVRLLDRTQQPAVDMDNLTAQVDEGMVATDGERGDGRALDQDLGGRHHQGDVLAGARLRLVGVDHQVAGASIGSGQKAPLHPGREASAATTPYAGVLGHLHEIGRRHHQGLSQCLVPVVLLVGRQRPGLGVIPEPGENRGQLGAHGVAFPSGAVVGPVASAARTSLRPASDAGPAPTPSSARPSWNPASTRETCLKVHTLDAPRVGATGAPERRSSTRALAEVGVWLSKNSQLAMTTGA